MQRSDPLIPRRYPGWVDRSVETAYAAWPAFSSWPSEAAHLLRVWRTLLYQVCRVVRVVSA